ncbi:metal-dependent hydrolase [Ilyomonas limi]|uniref:Metal-dependent hydrolase n=1 Tax=Ilyomonas limi TaxID=2575867 RepID=A0A4U3L578_9BACT|nr:metal-dependent hydrolase [Ilyomonas limi]TKK70351.1 metal-dependent hydrolase [Ilyomonas limi]
MDSITHMALGACIGEAVLYKRLGKKALAVGATAQSLPDIDVLASLWLKPPENLLAHRGITHSLLFGLVAAILLSIVVKRMLRSKEIKFSTLFLFCCFQLWLHDVLDTCNAYGTGLFEPFTHQRFSFHLLYVGDAFFSVSLIVAFVVLAFFLKRNKQQRTRWLWIGLLPACCYLIFAIFNKVLVKQQVVKSLQAKHILYKSTIITPTPFNTLLWYIVAATDSGYVVGYRSVFDRDSSLIPFTYYPKNEALLQQVDVKVNVKGLLHFADKYYTVEKVNDTLIFDVLRFGQVLGWQDAKAPFAFQYFLNPSYDNTLVVQRGRFIGWNRKTIINMYERIKGR